MSEDIEFEFVSDDQFDNEEEDEEAVAVENLFYEADDNKRRDPAKALSQFKEVISLEGDRESPKSYKSLQSAAVLCFRLGLLDEAALHFGKMLTMTTAVTRNEAAEAINAVLEAAGQYTDAPNQDEGARYPPSPVAAGGSNEAFSALERIYIMTIEILQKNNSFRLWVNTCLRLVKIYLARPDVQKAQDLLKDLHRSCLKPDGTDDIEEKGGNLLEIYAYEILLCSLTKNALRMKEIYPKTIHLTHAVADPRSVAIIKESSGKTHMSEKKWSAAYNEFFDAFKNYQEAGNAARAKMALKYVLLANMLSLSDINLFESNEAKAFQADPEIHGLRLLRIAFDNNDLPAIETVIKNPTFRICEDPFVSEHLEDLLSNIRVHLLLRVSLAYDNISIPYLCSELRVEEIIVYPLIIKVALDHDLDVNIDEVAGFVFFNNHRSESSLKAAALRKWSEALAETEVQVARRGAAAAQAAVAAFAGAPRQPSIWDMQP